VDNIGNCCASGSTAPESVRRKTRSHHSSPRSRRPYLAHDDRWIRAARSHLYWGVRSASDVGTLRGAKNLRGAGLPTNALGRIDFAAEASRRAW
jgi:hypothetical protein